MRLLVIYQHAPTPGAPGIYRHRILLAEMVRRGHEVHVIASPANYLSGTVPARYRRRIHTREEIDGVVHHWVPAWYDIRSGMMRALRSYAAFASHAVYRGLRLPRPDVVWASSPPLPVATAGRALARVRRVPFVLEVRDLWPESLSAAGTLDPSSLPYRLALAEARRVTAAAASVIVPTPGLRDDVQQHGARDIHVVTNIVQPVQPDPNVRHKTRRELGIRDDECLFLYVGALGAPNGVATLVRAIELLPKAVNARVVIAGGGQEASQLTAAAKRLGDDRLNFLGVVSKDKVPELLAAADVGLHLLVPDAVFAAALPTKMMEYMAAYRPTITTAIGLPTEIAIAAGGAAADHNPESLATALRRWSEMSPAERMQRGETAARYGAERFGLSSSASSLEDALRLAVRKSARGR